MSTLAKKSGDVYAPPMSQQLVSLTIGGAVTITYPASWLRAVVVAPPPPQGEVK